MTADAAVAPGSRPRMRAAVLGSPIDHSLSPVLHRAGYAALGLSGCVYDRCEVDEAGLADFLDTHPEHRGFSLTMPLKHALLELAAARGWEIDSVAARTGAGNTLTRLPDGSVRVTNTDVAGIVRALRAAGVGTAGPRPLRAAVLGGGATAASATAALAELGAGSIEFSVRTPARAAAVHALAEELGIEASVGLLADWRPGEADITVSTLPAGALAGVGLAWPERFAQPAALLDVAYARAEPDLLAEFTARGGTAVPGTRMLVHQAVEQFLGFTAAAGCDLDTPEHRARLVAAMLDALPRAAGA